MFDLLYRAALVGGDVLLGYFEKELTISEKGSHHNVVTIADITAQKTISDSLMKGMSDLGYDSSSVGFIGEENLHEEKEYTFILDPLDGTSNFTSGLDIFCVSIALYRNKAPLAGIIYFPVTGVSYFAEAGKGAQKSINSKTVSLKLRKADRSRSLMLTNISSTGSVRKEILKICDRAMDHFKNIRTLGAAAYDLALFADNRAGAVVYGKTSIWDIAAGIIIVREAGGELYDWEGNRIELDFGDRDKKYQFVATEKDNWQSVKQWL